MEEPKYKIGDEVWTLEGNHIQENIIVAVLLLKDANLYAKTPVGVKTSKKNFLLAWVKKPVLVLHTESPSEGESFSLCSDAVLFPTKQSLIDSL